MAVNILTGRQSPGGRIGALELDASLNVEHRYENDVTMYPIEDGSFIADNVRQTPEKVIINGFITNSPIKSQGADAADRLLNIRETDTSSPLFRFGNQIRGIAPAIISGQRVGGLQGAASQAQIIGTSLKLRRITQVEVEIMRTAVVDSEIPNRVETAFEKLLQIGGYTSDSGSRGVDLRKTKDAQMIDIVTGLQVYSNMVMVSLSVPRSRVDGDSMQFTAEFMKIQVVNSKLSVITRDNTNDFQGGRNNAADRIGNQASSKVDVGGVVPEERPKTFLKTIFDAGSKRGLY